MAVANDLTFTATGPGSWVTSVSLLLDTDAGYAAAQAAAALVGSVLGVSVAAVSTTDGYQATSGWALSAAGQTAMLTNTVRDDARNFGVCYQLDAAGKAVGPIMCHQTGGYTNVAAKTLKGGQTAMLHVSATQQKALSAAAALAYTGASGPGVTALATCATGTTNLGTRQAADSAFTFTSVAPAAPATDSAYAALSARWLQPKYESDVAKYTTFARVGRGDKVHQHVYWTQGANALTNGTPTQACLYAAGLSATLVGATSLGASVAAGAVLATLF